MAKFLFEIEVGAKNLASQMAAAVGALSGGAAGMAAALGTFAASCATTSGVIDKHFIAIGNAASKNIVAPIANATDDASKKLAEFRKSAAVALNFDTLGLGLDLNKILGKTNAASFKESLKVLLHGSVEDAMKTLGDANVGEAFKKIGEGLEKALKKSASKATAATKAAMQVASASPGGIGAGVPAKDDVLPAHRMLQALKLLKQAQIEFNTKANEGVLVEKRHEDALKKQEDIRKRANALLDVGKDKAAGAAMSAKTISEADTKTAAQMAQKGTVSMRTQEKILAKRMESIIIIERELALDNRKVDLQKKINAAYKVASQQGRMDDRTIEADNVALVTRLLALRVGERVKLQEIRAELNAIELQNRNIAPFLQLQVAKEKEVLAAQKEYEAEEEEINRIHQMGVNLQKDQEAAASKIVGLVVLEATARKDIAAIEKADRDELEKMLLLERQALEFSKAGLTVDQKKIELQTRANNIYTKMSAAPGGNVTANEKANSELAEKIKNIKHGEYEEIQKILAELLKVEGVYRDSIPSAVKRKADNAEHLAELKEEIAFEKNKLSLIERANSIAKKLIASPGEDPNKLSLQNFAIQGRINKATIDQKQLISDVVAEITKLEKHYSDIEVFAKRKVVVDKAASDQASSEQANVKEINNLRSQSIQLENTQNALNRAGASITVDRRKRKFEIAAMDAQERADFASHMSQMRSYAAIEKNIIADKKKSDSDSVATVRAQRANVTEINNLRKQSVQLEIAQNAANRIGAGITVDQRKTKIEIGAMDATQRAAFRSHMSEMRSYLAIDKEAATDKNRLAAEEKARVKDINDLRSQSVQLEMAQNAANRAGAGITVDDRKTRIEIKAMDDQQRADFRDHMKQMRDYLAIERGGLADRKKGVSEVTEAHRLVNRLYEDRKRLAKDADDIDKAVIERRALHKVVATADPKALQTTVDIVKKELLLTTELKENADVLTSKIKLKNVAHKEEHDLVDSEKLKVQEVIDKFQKQHGIVLTINQAMRATGVGLDANVSNARRFSEAFTAIQEAQRAANATLNTFGSTISRVLSQLKSFAMMGAGMFTGFIASTTALANNIRIISEETGASLEVSQRMVSAIGQFGATASQAEVAMKKLAKSAEDAIDGNAGLMKSFDKLNMPVNVLLEKRKDFTQLFQDVLTGISKIPNHLDRAAVATSLLGRSTVQLTAMWAEGGVEFNKYMSEAPAMTDVQIKAIIKLSMTVQDLIARFRVAIANVLADSDSAVRAVISVIKGMITTFEEIGKYLGGTVITFGAISIAVALVILGLGKLIVTIIGTIQALSGLTTASLTASGAMQKLGFVGTMVARFGLAPVAIAITAITVVLSAFISKSINAAAALADSAHKWALHTDAVNKDTKAILENNAANKKPAPKTPDEAAGSVKTQAEAVEADKNALQEALTNKLAAVDKYNKARRDQADATRKIEEEHAKGNYGATGDKKKDTKHAELMLQQFEAAKAEKESVNEIAEANKNLATHKDALTAAEIRLKDAQKAAGPAIKSGEMSKSYTDAKLAIEGTILAMKNRQKEGKRISEEELQDVKRTLEALAAIADAGGTDSDQEKKKRETLASDIIGLDQAVHTNHLRILNEEMKLDVSALENKIKNHKIANEEEITEAKKTALAKIEAAELGPYTVGKRQEILTKFANLQASYHREVATMEYKASRQSLTIDLEKGLITEAEAMKRLASERNHLKLLYHDSKEFRAMNKQLIIDENTMIHLFRAKELQGTKETIAATVAARKEASKIKHDQLMYDVQMARDKVLGALAVVEEQIAAKVAEGTLSIGDSERLLFELREKRFHAELNFLKQERDVKQAAALDDYNTTKKHYDYFAALKKKSQGDLAKYDSDKHSDMKREAERKAANANIVASDKGMAEARTQMNKDSIEGTKAVVSYEIASGTKTAAHAKDVLQQRKASLEAFKDEMMNLTKFEKQNSTDIVAKAELAAQEQIEAFKKIGEAALNKAAAIENGALREQAIQKATTRIVQDEAIVRQNIIKTVREAYETEFDKLFDLMKEFGELTKTSLKSMENALLAQIMAVSAAGGTGNAEFMRLLATIKKVHTELAAVEKKDKKTDSSFFGDFELGQVTTHGGEKVKNKFMSGADMGKTMGEDTDIFHDLKEKMSGAIKPLGTKMQELLKQFTGKDALGSASEHLTVKFRSLKTVVGELQTALTGTIGALTNQGRNSMALSRVPVGKETPAAIDEHATKKRLDDKNNDHFDMSKYEMVNGQWQARPTGRNQKRTYMSPKEEALERARQGGYVPKAEPKPNPQPAPDDNASPGDEGDDDGATGTTGSAAYPNQISTRPGASEQPKSQPAAAAPATVTNIFHIAARFGNNGVATTPAMDGALRVLSAETARMQVAANKGMLNVVSQSTSTSSMTPDATSNAIVASHD